MSDVTQILSAIEQGDAQATEQLLPPGSRRVSPADDAENRPGGACPRPLSVWTDCVASRDANSNLHTRHPFKSRFTAPKSTSTWRCWPSLKLDGKISTDRRQGHSPGPAAISSTSPLQVCIARIDLLDWLAAIETRESHYEASRK